MPDRRRSWAWVALAVFVIAGAVVVLHGTGTDSPADRAPGSLLSGPTDGRSERDDSAGETEVDETSGLKTETASPPTSTTKKRALAVRDTPAAPAPAPDPNTDSAWQEYLGQTQRVVYDNQASLVEMAAKIAAALSARDTGTLAGYLAPDEGAQTAYVDSIANRYPALLTSSQTPTVNVFAVNDATVYIAYVLVTWSDGGITSQHTVPLPMRFVNGEWCLTSLDDSTDGLLFVQSVQL